jgi:hypothetical protein
MHVLHVELDARSIPPPSSLDQEWKIVSDSRSEFVPDKNLLLLQITGGAAALCPALCGEQQHLRWELRDPSMGSSIKRLGRQ